MPPGGSNDVNIYLDEDNEQSKPLLGEASVGNEQGCLRAKVAEYLPGDERSGFVHRILRTLYGSFPAEDVPRVAWVSIHLAILRIMQLFNPYIRG